MVDSTCYRLKLRKKQPKWGKFDRCRPMFGDLLSVAGGPEQEDSNYNPSKVFKRRDSEGKLGTFDAAHDLGDAEPLTTIDVNRNEASAPGASKTQLHHVTVRLCAKRWLCALRKGFHTLARADAVCIPRHIGASRCLGSQGAWSTPIPVERGKTEQSRPAKGRSCPKHGGRIQTKPCKHRPRSGETALHVANVGPVLANSWATLVGVRQAKHIADAWESTTFQDDECPDSPFGPNSAEIEPELAELGPLVRPKSMPSWILATSAHPKRVDCPRACPHTHTLRARFVDVALFRATFSLRGRYDRIRADIDRFRASAGRILTDNRQTSTEVGPKPIKCRSQGWGRTRQSGARSQGLADPGAFFGSKLPDRGPKQQAQSAFQQHVRSASPSGPMLSEIGPDLAEVGAELADCGPSSDDMGYGHNSTKVDRIRTNVGRRHAHLVDSWNMLAEFDRFRGRGRSAARAERSPRRAGPARP